MSLKGSGIAFDNNLDEFRDSINTSKINNPIDIRQLIGFNSHP